MNSILHPLPQPEGFNQSSDMWIDEEIWGHRLHDEQLPWFIFLEFLTVFHHELGAHRAFEESSGYNTLKYQAASRLYLRNIIFNNPYIAEVRSKFPNDINRWEEWNKLMQKGATGLIQPNFSFIKDSFHSFDDFYEVFSLVQSANIEGESNKRWSSKFIFPFGKECLYEDLNNRATTNDRRFFGRTGELLYLMFCRANRK